jgi:hypothetical protein
MNAPALWTADTVTWSTGSRDGRLSLYLPGGAEVRAVSRKAKGDVPAAHWFACQRCEARTRDGLRHDDPADQLELRTFLAAHAGAVCPPPPAATTKPRRSR